MSKKIIFLISLSLLISNASGQSKTEKLKLHIITLEKSGWDAWKNNNANWFQTNTAKECLWISSGGISNKKQMITSVPTDCNVSFVSLDNFKFVQLNKHVVILTYTVNQIGECNGTTLTENIRASVTYIKQSGKWLEALYMETPLVD